MRVHLLILWCVPAALILFSQPVIAGTAGQEIPQCYVGAQPCGTPEHLYQRIVQCLQDPLLCSEATARHQINYSPSSDALLHGPVSSSTPDHLAHQGIPKLPPTEGKSKTQDRTESTSISHVSLPIQSTAEEFREYRLDPTVLALHDEMPADAGVIERHLGLRRTRVEGTDLRGRTPSVAEIVSALAPMKRLD
jgi:hypothetical protein